MATAVVSIAADDRSETAYCEVSDVLNLLTGVAKDDDNRILGQLLGSAEISALISELLPYSKYEFDAMTSYEDCNYHEDIDITVDGDGSSALDLGALGFRPLLEVSNFTIDGSAVGATNYSFDRDGFVMTDNILAATMWTPPWSSESDYFAHGMLNITATITWGFPTVPAPAKRGQAALTAAEILSQVGSADGVGPAMYMASMQRVTIGDMSFASYSDGPYGRRIKFLKETAQRAATMVSTSHVTFVRPHPR